MNDIHPNVYIAVMLRGFVVDGKNVCEIKKEIYLSTKRSKTRSFEINLTTNVCFQVDVFRINVVSVGGSAFFG